MSDEPYYKVIFQNKDQVYEVYATGVYQSDLYGFIEVEEFLFGERSNVLVDPGEEKLKNEFSGVSRSYLPIQSIIRIDEVEREGVAKITDSASGSDKVAHLPLPASRKPVEPRD